MILDYFRRRLRRLLSPELLDDAVGRDGLVRIDDQQGEEGPLLAARELYLEIPVAYLDGSEDPKIHYRRMTVTPCSQTA